MAQTMHARNAISAKMAECYVTIDGNRYNFMSAINVEVTFEKEKTEVPILGRMNKGHKSTSPLAEALSSILPPLFGENWRTSSKRLVKIFTSICRSQTRILLHLTLDGRQSFSMTVTLTPLHSRRLMRTVTIPSLRALTSLLSALRCPRSLRLCPE